MMNALSAISGSLQLGAQAISPFSSYEDDLNKLSFGLGAFVDTKSVFTRSQEIHKKSYRDDKKVDSKIAIAATALHYTNLINQFFPTHPLLSLGLFTSELVLSLSNRFGNPTSEHLSNTTYMLSQFTHLLHLGQGQVTFYGNLRSHADFRGIQQSLKKIHPLGKELKILKQPAVVSYLEQRINGVASYGNEHPFFKRSITISLDQPSPMNTVLHMFLIHAYISPNIMI